MFRALKEFKTTAALFRNTLTLNDFLSCKFYPKVFENNIKFFREY